MFPKSSFKGLCLFWDLLVYRDFNFHATTNIGQASRPTALRTPEPKITQIVNLAVLCSWREQYDISISVYLVNEL